MKKNQILAISLILISVFAILTVVLVADSAFAAKAVKNTDSVKVPTYNNTKVFCRSFGSASVCSSLDMAYCPGSGYCVFNNKCYQGVKAYSVGVQNDKKTICSIGGWLDCDDTQFNFFGSVA